MGRVHHGSQPARLSVSGVRHARAGASLANGISWRTTRFGAPLILRLCGGRLRSCQIRRGECFLWVSCIRKRTRPEQGRLNGAKI